MRIYLDLVVLLNFGVDYLLFLGTNRLSGFPSDWKRLFLASALGGFYAGCCLLPGFHFLGNLLWRMVFLTGMAVIAFGWNRSAARRCGMFLLLSMALGGISLSINSSHLSALLLAGAGMWLLCSVCFGGNYVRQNYLPVRLAYGGRTMDLVALHDTGNTLRDPVSGEQVLVVAGEVAQKLLGLTEAQLHMPLETLELRPLPGLRLIPYSVVGRENSMLLAMRMENVRIGSQVRSTIVAFAPEGLGKGTVYQALTGGML